MTFHKLKENRYVVYFAVLIFVLVLCSLITEFNLLDLGYIVFLVICFLRYLYICKNNWLYWLISV